MRKIEELAGSKWTINEYRDRIAVAAKVYDPAYYPNKKQWLKNRGLSRFLYDNENKLSLFLHYCVLPPKVKTERRMEEKYDAAPESVKDRYEELYPIFDPEQKQKAKWYKALIEFRDEIADEEERRDPKVKYKYTKGYRVTLGMVLYGYTSWVIREYTEDEKRFVSPNAFTVDSKLWLRFLDENYG
jgi:hypothetical protein